MQFGQKNEPGKFKCFIDVILSTATFQYALFYLYDIVFFSQSMEYHNTYFRLVLTLLETAGVNQKKNEFLFFSDTKYYLVCVIQLGLL